MRLSNAKRFSVTCWSLMAIIFCLGAVRPAHARNDSEIKRLSQALKDLQAAWREQGADIAQKMAQIEAMQNEWNGFQGTVDAISQQQQLLLDQLNKYIDEFDSRLRKVEERLAINKASGENNAPALSKMASLGEKNHEAEVELYQQGLQSVRTRNYDAAISTFRNFVSHHPHSNFADGAQYWIAECLNAKGETAKAIAAYQVVIDRFPESKKIPAALFKQARGYLLLGQNGDAKKQLQQILAIAPQSSVAKRAITQLRLMEQGTATAERTPQ